MPDSRSTITRAAAEVRAREYRAQAEAYRRLAAVEPLEQKRQLLELSASKYDEVAEGEERIAYGTQRESRIIRPYRQERDRPDEVGSYSGA